MLRRAAPLLLAAAAALAAGCRQGSPPVVLISIDTLRADRLPAYGYEGVETPAIDALRRDGILFTSAWAQAPLTLPSHVSLLSGRLPGEHGVRDNLGYPVAAALDPWLPSALSARGYATGGFVSAYVLRGVTGFGRGFDRFDDRMPSRRGRPAGAVSRPGAETLTAALAWLDTAVERPVFLFLHLYEPHTPYAPPQPFAEAYRSRPYDGEIAESDRLVGELVAGLRRRGLYDRALVILVSDHGEGLGDHGEDEHGVLLYREALHVPLLVKLPQMRRAGETVATPVALTDVTSTVAAVAGIEMAAVPDGRSLLDPAPDRRVHGESVYGQLHYGWHPLHSVVEGSRHFIDSGALELFDLATDPAERHNLADSERRTTQTLRQAASQRATPVAAAAPADAETRANLAALGYLGGTSATAIGRGDLPPPQERITVLREFEGASDLLRSHRSREAATALQRILEREPLIVDGWARLGRAHTMHGDWRAALEAYERAFELTDRNPDYAFQVAAAKLELGRREEAFQLARWAQSSGALDSETQAQLGRRFLARGRPAEAEEILRAIPSAAGDAAGPIALAELLSATGRAAEAREVAAGATDQSPDDPGAFEQLALACLHLGDHAAAAAAATRAVELDPRRANVWNLLGVARFSLGEADAAFAAWERAIAVDPELYDTLYNLGVKAAEAGRSEQAVSALRRFLASAPPDRYAADYPRVRALLATLGG
jgi:arylsulfatase A-like enzyme/Tfp pilus assembly protein PilF